MWWERWIPGSYLTKSSVCGVECVFADNGITYHYAVLQTRKNKIEIAKQGTTIDLNDVVAVAKKASAPLCLVLSGKGIMLKKIMFSGSDALDLKDLMQQHLPAIPTTEFYTQFYQNETASGHIALCRKEQFDQLMEHVAKLKGEVANVYIGAAVCNALALVTASYNRLTTSTQRLELSNGFLEESHPVGDTDSVNLSIDGLSVAPEQVLAFAAGFGYLSRQEVYSTSNAELQKLPKQHSEKIKVRMLLFFFIAILFVISGINSVLFFQKFEQNNTLEVELNLYESKNSQITKLLEEYQKKKSLIEQAGVFDHKKISVYADKIAASLPQDIVLREMYFNPEDGEAELDSLADFRQNELIIKGNCSKSLLLNDWVNVLKSQSFVKSVNLENYIFSSEGHLPNFVLKLRTE
jgi:Tfp pilus assembly protein PilN